MSTPDILIAGAGIIGLSLALELRRRGASVVVLEQNKALRGASHAAAGMLAAEDPHNPAALLAFSRHSLAFYPDFLIRIESLSGQAVPLQTSSTVQYAESGSYRLAEHSLDPRQLCSALLAAARAAGIVIVEHLLVASVENTGQDVTVRAADGVRYEAGQFVRATGAWPAGDSAATVISPRKGQMLRVAMPSDTPLQTVHRAEHVYVVPRATGPQAGSALIGATVEDAGFDLTTSFAQLQKLRHAAASLSPETAFVAEAPLLEAWAGLRPHTPDYLPLLGKVGEREWIATGHFRNGILLAPGTAVILADLLSGKSPGVDLSPFAPDRFNAHRLSDIRPILRDNANRHL